TREIPFKTSDQAPRPPNCGAVSQCTSKSMKAGFVSTDSMGRRPLPRERTLPCGAAWLHFILVDQLGTYQHSVPRKSFSGNNSAPNDRNTCEKNAHATAYAHFEKPRSIARHHRDILSTNTQENPQSSCFQPFSNEKLFRFRVSTTHCTIPDHRALRRGPRRTLQDFRLHTHSPKHTRLPMFQNRPHIPSR